MNVAGYNCRSHYSWRSYQRIRKTRLQTRQSPFNVPRLLRCNAQTEQKQSSRVNVPASPPEHKRDPKEQISLTVDDLNKAADRLLSGDKDAPSVEALADGLGVTLGRGLPESKAGLQDRERRFGANRLPSRDEVSLLELLLNALNDITVIVLIVSGVLSLVLDFSFNGGKSWVEGAAILAAVTVVVLVTAINDFQKEKQFRELSELSEESEVTIVRNGKQQEVSTADLVVGDVLLFGYGDILAVDGVLIQGDNIRVDESALTGESEDVVKTAGKAPFLRSGSNVLEGQGRLLVTAVGTNSQQGQIFGALNAPSDGMREETALQRKLDKLAGQIGQLGLAAAAFALLAMAGQFTYSEFIVGNSSWDWEYLSTYLHFLITAITIVVVAVPEGLPLAVTVALAFSVKRMLKDNNLVRRLSAAETMGCATTICSDKTGTLTQNRMTVLKLWIAGKLQDNLTDYALMTESDRPCTLSDELPTTVNCRLSEAIMLNCSAELRRQDDTGELLRVGNRTECSLLELVERLDCNVDAILEEHEILKRVPFSSERKRMTTIVGPSARSNGSERRYLYTKGAAEVMLEECSTYLAEDGSVVQLEDSLRKEVLNKLQGDGLRTIMIAYRDVTDLLSRESARSAHIYDLEKDLTLIGVAGIADPLRPEVVEAIKSCSRAGITVRMLTGDSAATAASIAHQAGILEQDSWNHGDRDRTAEASSSGRTEPHSSGTILEGRDFRQRVLDDKGNIKQQDFDKTWGSLRVMARCSPTDKLTIVKGLQNNPEEVVCMTGDGTNDAPALKAADIGFAMNNGTSIAKESADILLLDSNFQSIVKSVLWGRNVYAGITKFLQFQLVVNVVAVITACTGAIVAQDSPLTAVQMLWVNLIMDSLASLALATEVPSEELLDLKPFSPSASLISPLILKGIVGQCVFQLAVMYGLVFHADKIFHISNDPSVLHGTLIFNTFVLMQLVNQVNARYINNDVNVLGTLFDNKLFLGILGGELLLQVLIVQIGGEVFSTTPLTGQQWAACAGFGALGFVVRGLLTLIPPKSKQ